MSQGNQGANQQRRGQQAPQQAGGQQGQAAQGGNYGRQPRGQYAGGPGGPGTDLAGPVKLGLATFLAIGFGVSITMFLFVTLVPGAGTGGLGTTGTLGLFGGAAQLTGALIIGFVMVVFAGPIVATGLGGFLGTKASPGESPALAGAASSAIGAAVTMILLIVLAILFAPGPGGAGGGIGQLIGPLIGAIVGIALTGAAGGAIGQKLS